MTSPKDYQPLAGSEHPPHPATKRLDATDASAVTTVQIIIRRNPDGPALKDLDYFQRVPIGSRKLPSREEFEEAHGSTQADLDAVRAFCQSQGLSVTEANRSRRRIVARGTVGQMNAAFGVALIDFESSNGRYHGFDGAVHVPTSLAGVVAAINGLDNRPIPVRHLGNADPSPIGTLTPPKVAQLYNFPSGTGAGQTIATYQPQGWGYWLSDVQSTLSNWGVTQTGSLTDFPPGSNSGQDDQETTMDITVAAAIAPAANIVVYFNQGNSAADIISTMTSMIHPTGTDPVPTIIFICYEWSADDETSFLSASQYTQLSGLFQDAANLSITTLTGSADAGAYIDNPVQAQTVYPGTDPYLLCCGGTSIGNIQGSTFEEWVWNDITSFVIPQGQGHPSIHAPGATGGGISARFPVPPYQSAIALPVRNGPGTSGRGIPDVAGNASGNSGYVVWTGGSPYPPGGAQGGTSVVAPLYAGLVARINQSLGADVGFLNPQIYEWGLSVCRDVTAANGPTNNDFTVPAGQSGAGTVVTGYTAGPNWDACTGWGSIDGSKLLSALQSLFPRTVTLVLERSTFGKDEVTSLLAGGSQYTYPDVLYVQVDGFFPAQFGLTASNLWNPPNLSTWLTFAGSFTGLSTNGVSLTFDTSTGTLLEDSTDLYLVQRITFPFNVQFQTVNGQLQVFNGVPASPGYADYSLSATITSIYASPGLPAASAASDVAEIQFVLQADPYMVAGESWWLSNDMRVFTVQPNVLPSGNVPLQYSSTQWTGDPNTYIQTLIKELNNTPSFANPATTDTPFTGISPLESSTQTSLALSFDPANAVYNFGLARVHLQGDSTTDPVRVFFRLFISPSPDTDFNSATTFRSHSETDSSGNIIPETLIPLLGFPTNDMSTTIPFFANGRIVSTTEDMTRQSDAPTNAFPIQNTSGGEVYAYFGCYLDLNQSTPQFPLDPSSTPHPNGPWSTNAIQSIPSIIMGQHACLVAELSYDPDPIPAGANAATSDKIGQRNLSWGGADTTFFDVRRTSPKPPRDILPDELMIEWGNVPHGSVASVYWPGVAATEVLELADRFYRNSQLTKSDDHTIRCITGSITYIPIPAGTGPNLAGLLSVETPKTVRAGEQFSVLVRRLSWRSAPKFRDNAAILSWRYVVGAFQMNIAVREKKELLLAEESILALYKWKLMQIPANNRWHPVIRRYIARVSGTIKRLGGDPGAVGPSQIGRWTTPKPHPAERLEYTGKVMGLAFDRFGDFEGFLLLTESGEEMPFRAREQAIEDRVREAWKDRMVISVFVEPPHPQTPVLILFRRAPSQ